MVHGAIQRQGRLRHTGCCIEPIPRAVTLRARSERVRHDAARTGALDAEPQLAYSLRARLGHATMTELMQPTIDTTPGIAKPVPSGLPKPSSSQARKTTAQPATEATTMATTGWATFRIAQLKPRTESDASNPNGGPNATQPIVMKAKPPKVNKGGTSQIKRGTVTTEMDTTTRITALRALIVHLAMRSDEAFTRLVTMPPVRPCLIASTRRGSCWPARTMSPSSRDTPGVESADWGAAWQSSVRFAEDTSTPLAPRLQR